MHAIYDPLFDHHSSSTEFPDITKSVIDDMISEGKMNLDLSKVQSYVAEIEKRCFCAIREFP